MIKNILILESGIKNQESGVRNQEFRNDKESFPGINITIFCVVPTDRATGVACMCLEIRRDFLDERNALTRHDFRDFLFFFTETVGLASHNSTDPDIFYHHIILDL